MTHSFRIKLAWFLWILLILMTAIPTFLLVGMITLGIKGVIDMIIVVGLLYVIYDLGKTIVTLPPWRIKQYD